MRTHHHLALAMLTVGAAFAEDVSYTFRDLTPPGATSSSAGRIDDSGDIRGWAAIGTGANAPFFWRAGTFGFVNEPGAIGVNIYEITDWGLITGSAEDSNYRDHYFASFRKADGTVMSLPPQGALNCTIAPGSSAGLVAGTFSATGGASHVFALAGESFVDFTPAGATSAQCVTVSPGGTVAGTFVDADGVTHGFAWKAGVFSNLLPAGGHDVRIIEDLEKSEWVFGSFYNAAGHQAAFAGKDGVSTALLPAGAKSSGIFQANALGRAAGSFTDANGYPHAFTWKDGVFTDLSAVLPSGLTSYALSVSSNGIVTGSYYVPDSGQFAFSWDAGTLALYQPTGARSCQAWVTEAGQIVGYFTDNTGQYHAFVVYNGVLTDLTPTGAKSSGPNIAAKGGRLLDWYIDADGKSHAFTWAAGVFTDLTPDGASSSIAQFTNTGDITGSSTRTEGNFAFLWRDGVLTEFRPAGAITSWISSIQPSGLVIGTTADANGHYAGFLWDSVTFQQIAMPGASSTQIASVNASGLKVGTSIFGDASNHPHAFVWRDGVFTDLFPNSDGGARAMTVTDDGLVQGTRYAAGSSTSIPYAWKDGAFLPLAPDDARRPAHIWATSPEGWMVGSFLDATQHLHAFVNQNGVFTDLSAFLPEGTTDSESFSINAAGQIVGSYQGTDNVSHAFLLDRVGPVPTPSGPPEPTPPPTPEPTATPPPSAPSFNLRPKLHTTKSQRVAPGSTQRRVQGTCTGKVLRVRYRVAGGEWRKANGAKHWRFTVSLLKRNRTVVTVRAFGPGGRTSTQRIVFRRG